MSFITFRRYHLDLVMGKTEFYGRVLDVGGKKENRRGSFLPPLDQVDTWEYLNLDPQTHPDYLCSAESIPVADETFDIVVLAEVLEHLQNPERVLIEIYRVLKRGGIIVATMPFLFPVHADPYDFQRWTPAKLKIEFERPGFIIKQVECMGGVFAVIHDLLYCAMNNAQQNKTPFSIRLLKKVFSYLKGLFQVLDTYIGKSEIISTGYCVRAYKQ